MRLWYTYSLLYNTEVAWVGGFGGGRLRVVSGGVKRCGGVSRSIEECQEVLRSVKKYWGEPSVKELGKATGTWGVEDSAGV